MTVLSRQTILSYQSRPAGARLIASNFKNDSVRTASYDLCIGSEYSLSTTDHLDPHHAANPPSSIFRQLSSTSPLIEIPANGIVMVESDEVIKVHRNMVAHATLKMDLLLKGIIMASQSQIDAGFFGRVFCLLYNLSDTPVVLRYRKPFLRLEFAFLDETVPIEHAYQGDFQDVFQLSDALPARITSSLERMQSAVTGANDRIATLLRRELFGAMLVGLTLLLIVAAFAVPIYFGLFGVGSNSQDQINSLKTQVQVEERQLQSVENQEKKQEKSSRSLGMSGGLRSGEMAQSSQPTGTVAS
jgi:deoxycytidine triphosphate deaminase